MGIETQRVNITTSNGYGNSPEAETIAPPQTLTIKAALRLLLSKVEDKSRLLSLAMGDPSTHACFSITPHAEESVVAALQSQNFNGYAPTSGLPQARSAIAEYLSRDLPYKLSSNDVYITSGCTQAIDAAMTNLYRPSANILLPKPGFPIYELCASFRHVQVRHFDLLPERNWEADLDAVEAIADQNTVALVIVNPGNPCGSVYSHTHLKEIADIARKLKIIVIADEVYGHLVFGGQRFVPMGVFGSVVPVLTLGSLSKRWIVPGWRLGWFVITDKCGTFKNPKNVERLEMYFDLCGGPATFIQAAVPQILAQTEDDFYKKTLNILKQASDICCSSIDEIPCITCPQKPSGSMSVMMKLDLSLLKDVNDDFDFCLKLATEEYVILIPGCVVGLKNWIRITFAVDPSTISHALERVKAFCKRHAAD